MALFLKAGMRVLSMLHSPPSRQEYGIVVIIAFAVYFGWHTQIDDTPSEGFIRHLLASRDDQDERRHTRLYFSNGELACRQGWAVSDEGTLVLHGITEMWRRDGTLARVVLWKDGLRSGADVTFDEVGNIRQFGQYEGDRATGIWHRVDGETLIPLDEADGL
jgi:hypothetical protein